MKTQNSEETRGTFDLVCGSLNRTQISAHQPSFRLEQKAADWRGLDGANQLPEATGEMFGYARHDFLVDGKQVTVLAPRRERAGRPWAWKGEFLDAFPATEIALVGLGFHVVYLDMPNLFGSPVAVSAWDKVYATLVGSHGFARRVALIGLSRGGLYCYNWAAANPEKVACIYADAPVCDIKSWPSGFGCAPRSEANWLSLLEAYSFCTENEVRAFRGNPVDQLAPLSAARIPLLHVFGDTDEAVPWEENTGLLVERYRQLGGAIQLIRKPGIGHHPHGLEDPTPIVRFIMDHASPLCNKPSGRSGAGAFTLVELLAVIAIIAVLAILTIGAVKNAMTGAQRIGCAANLRQVGQAIMLYANDNNGLLPGNGAGSVGPRYVNGVPSQGAYPYVAIALAPYIPDSVWADPDPFIKRSLVWSKGALWFKVNDPYYSASFPHPLSCNSYPNPVQQDGQRILAYPRPAMTPLLRCNGETDPSSGKFYWAHNGKLNYLYLDCHIEVFNPSPSSWPVPW